MTPAPLDLPIYRGDSYDLPLRLRERLPDGTNGDPLDLTGCTITAQIRAKEDATELRAAFTVDVSNAAQGEVTLSLSEEETAVLKDGVWDLQVVWPDGDIRTYLKGRVHVTKDVTRP